MIRGRSIWLSLLLVTALPACRSELGLEASVLRIRASKQLSAEQRTQLANHLPGIFGIPEICAVFEESIRNGGYVPTEPAVVGDTARTLVCEQHRIGIAPKSTATFWRFRNGLPILEVNKGAAVAELPPGEFVFAAGEHTFTIRNATKSIFLLSRQEDRVDLRCRGGDAEVVFAGPPEGVSLASEGCRMKLQTETTAGEPLTILSGSAFWIVDAQVPETIRATPPELVSANLPPPWLFLRRPALQRTPASPTTWNLSEAENCTLFEIDPATQKEKLAEPPVALTSEIGTLPPAFANRSLYLRCEYDGMPSFSELSAPIAIPPPPPLLNAPPPAAPAPTSPNGK